MKKKILITGAAGNLGGRLFDILSKKYFVLGTDIKQGNQNFKNSNFILCDLKDYKKVLRITKKIYAIVHFGSIPVEDTFKNILNNNIFATYNVFEAARINKVKKIIFASSNHVVGFHKRKTNLDEKCMQRPDTNYGLSKCFGENISRLYADKFNIKGFCIRIGSCLDQPTDRRHLSTWISPNDLAQLVDIGISKKYHFEIVYGISNNNRSWWNNKAAFKLGYKPKDRAEDYSNKNLSRNEYVSKIALKFQGGVFVSKGFKGIAADIK